MNCGKPKFFDKGILRRQYGFALKNMVIRIQAAWRHAEGSTTRESKLMERAIQHRNKKGVICVGCKREFGRININHINLCEGLKRLNIFTKEQYKEKIGPTSASYLIKIANKTIASHNKNTTSEQKQAWGRMGYDKTKELHPEVFSVKRLQARGKLNAKTLWSKEGQKEIHKKRLIEMNINNLMFQGPNKLELFFQNLVNDKRLKFVGHLFWKTVKSNGVIKYITPDFRISKTNLIVEIFGNYWHKKHEEPKRKKLWEQANCKCLVIWEKEIKNNPKKVVEKYNKFVSRNLQECLTPQKGEEIV